jgi:hypothetical protein
MPWTNWMNEWSNIPKGFFMKKIFLLSVLCCFCSTLHAQTQAPEEIIYPKNALTGAIGWGLETGVLGIQYRRLMSENIFLHGSLALDVLGAGHGFGGGYQTNLTDEKCLWLFGCKQRYRFSLGYLQYKGSTIDLSDSGETECEDGFCIGTDGVAGAKYDVSSSNAYMATFAWQSLLNTWFYYEFQFGYWVPGKKPTFTYKSGPQTSKDAETLDRFTNSHLSIGAALGMLF